MEELSKHIQENWSYEIRGASLLIAIDHQRVKEQDPECIQIRLIDLASVESKEEGFIDLGFLKGIESIIKILRVMLHEQELFDEQ